MTETKTSWWNVLGVFAAFLACIGYWVLATNGAWSVWSLATRVKVLGNLVLAHSAFIMLFVHIERDGVRTGIAAGVLLLLLGAVPFGYSFHYLFLGPSYGGLIGGIGAAIALLQFMISGSIVLSGVMLLRRMVWRRNRMNRLQKENQTAEPGATDNSDDAQRLREDH